MSKPGLVIWTRGDIGEQVRTFLILQNSLKVHMLHCCVVLIDIYRMNTKMYLTKLYRVLGLICQYLRV